MTDEGLEECGPGAAISWVFTGGALHGQPVLKTLRDYLQQVTQLLEEAERKLAS